MTKELEELLRQMESDEERFQMTHREQLCSVELEIELSKVLENTLFPKEITNSRAFQLQLITLMRLAKVCRRFIKEQVEKEGGVR